MRSLVTMLRRFNRKERYWVVRNALGPQSEMLDTEFSAALERVLIDRNVTIDPCEAWWGMDYHINWLFAVLQMYCAGVSAGRAFDNSSGAVQGNQEDIDLVVAGGKHLVLVEAKNGGWSSDQMRSKIERLKLLNADESGLVGEGEHSVQLHFVLMSPSKSDPNRGELRGLSATAPAWMRGQGAPGWRWMPLRIDEPAPDCRVHRSNEHGVKDKAGAHWTIAMSVDRRSQ